MHTITFITFLMQVQGVAYDPRIEQHESCKCVATDTIAACTVQSVDVERARHEYIFVTNDQGDPISANVHVDCVGDAAERPN